MADDDENDFGEISESAQEDVMNQPDTTSAEEEGEAEDDQAAENAGEDDED